MIFTSNNINCVSQHFGYSCSMETQTLYSINNTINNTIVRNFTVTWYAKEINKGDHREQWDIFSQLNNNGDHIHLCYQNIDEIIRYHLSYSLIVNCKQVFDKSNAINIYK